MEGTMTYKQSIQRFAEQLVGQQVQNISNKNPVVSIETTNGFVHAYTMVRFVHKEKLLFTSQQMFQEIDEQNGTSNFDLLLQQHKQLFVGNRVAKVLANDIGDVAILLENKSRIEMYINSGARQDIGLDQQYSMFHKQDSAELIVFANKKFHVNN